MPSITVNKSHSYNKVSIDATPLKWEALILVILIILSSIIYSNTLTGEFVFDDRPNILDNPHIRLTKLTLKGVADAGFKSPCQDRPIANISLALNYFFHQYNTTGYHLLNILIHIITGIFLYFFIKTTISIPGICEKRYVTSKFLTPSNAAFIAALIWLVHPVQTQSVTYIVQRMNSMSAMFYILSLFLYAKGRLSWRRKSAKKEIFRPVLFFTLSITAGILAMGSKEIAFTLPFIILLYEWYFFQDLKKQWLKNNFILLAGLIFILSCVALIFIGPHPFKAIMSGYAIRDFTLIQRVFTEFRVVVFYISLILLPHPSRLNLHHDFLLSYSLVNPVTTLLSLCAVLGLLSFAVYTAKKDRLLSFSILWFFINLLIESSVIGLEIIFEHRLYLPSMCISIIVVWVAYRLIKPGVLKAIAFFALASCLSFWTYQRNSIWENDITILKDCVKKSPNKARVHNNLGNVLAKNGLFEEAVGHFSKTLKINPNSAMVHNNMGNALKSQGNLKEAINHFEAALQLQPGYADAHYNMGLALQIEGDFDGAIGHYLKAIKLRPDYALAYNNLGIVHTMHDDLDEAISSFFKALQIMPDYADAHYNLGLALTGQGNFKEAVRHFSKALEINPGLQEARKYMGICLKKQGFTPP